MSLGALRFVATVNLIHPQMSVDKGGNRQRAKTRDTSAGSSVRECRVPQKTGQEPLEEDRPGQEATWSGGRGMWVVELGGVGRKHR